MKKSSYKKQCFHNFDYQCDFQKKEGKKVARGLSRARGKEIWKKEEFAD